MKALCFLQIPTSSPSTLWPDIGMPSFTSEIHLSVTHTPEPWCYRRNEYLRRSLPQVFVSSYFPIPVRNNADAIIPPMKYETAQGVRLPRIGFGTWKIGGGGAADPSLDERSMAALRSALELGYTHFDTAEYYAGGHAEELLGQAVRGSGIARDTLFITSKVSPEHLGYADLLHSCEKTLQRLGMDYLDLYLIHWPSWVVKLEETFRALNQLVSEGKVRHVGVSNFNLKLLRKSVELSGSGILTNQVSYSLPDRNCASNGVLAYCQENDIFLTAYSPVKRRFVSGNKTLTALAKEKGATPQQIALAWLIRQPKVITIPMSYDPAHQAENLAAAGIDLTEADVAQFDYLKKVNRGPTVH